MIERRNLSLFTKDSFKETHSNSDEEHGKKTHKSSKDVANKFTPPQLKIGGTGFKSNISKVTSLWGCSFRVFSEVGGWEGWSCLLVTLISKVTHWSLGSLLRLKAVLY